MMNDLTITYEITASVAHDLCAEYERYMIERHIPDLIWTGAFEGVTLSRSKPGRYRIRYEARGREALDQYLKQYADRLRQHFKETFPSGIELSREEWENLRTWPQYSHLV